MSRQTNVFYVDDDADDQMLFSEAFQEIQAQSSLKLNLFKAENGQDFFDVIAHTKVTPHITFLDINMPVKNGFQCLSEIRATDNLKHQPVIMLSTSESNEVISKSYSLGANKYIVKPPDFNALKNAIEKCLDEFKNEK
jgi:CheY-like chemotaxis protein